jgi:hypothetical protein
MHHCVRATPGTDREAVAKHLPCAHTYRLATSARIKHVAAAQTANDATVSRGTAVGATVFIPDRETGGHDDGKGDCGSSSTSVSGCGSRSGPPVSKPVDAHPSRLVRLPSLGTSPSVYSQMKAILRVPPAHRRTRSVGGCRSRRSYGVPVGVSRRHR